MKQIVTLENISCQNCVKHVTDHFQTLTGVSDVQIDLDTKVATVTTDHTYSAEDYQAALAKTIYKVVNVA